MAFKKKIEPSKKSRTHAEKERAQSRIIIIGFTITAILIVSLIVYAVLNESFFKYRISVAEVGDKKISGQEFIERVKLERKNKIDQFRYYLEIAQMFSADQNTYANFTNQLISYQNSLDNVKQFGESILNQMINEKIVTLQAEKYHLTVTDAEVDNYLQDQFGYFPAGTPTPSIIPTLPSTPTLSATQIAILRYTPTSILQPTNTSIPTKISISSTPTEEEKTTLTPQPTPTIYSKELYEKNLGVYYASLTTDGIDSSTLRNYFRYYLLQQKVMDEYNKNPQKAEQVWARHILVKTEADAKNVLSRLNSGEDWSKIAAEVSQDTSNKDQGGDLGWFPKGTMVKPFEEAAFALKIGEISVPVQTDFGWHVIQVLGHDNIPLGFEDWIASIKKETSIKMHNWEDLVPTTPTIPAELRLNAQQ